MALKDTIAVGMATPQAFLSNPIDMDQVRTVVQRAEALGFRDLWTTENTFGKIHLSDWKLGKSEQHFRD